MLTMKLTLLKFVGGPFDGFAQQIPADSGDLPLGVALPINNRSARLFGMEAGQSKGEAIYTLTQDEHVSRYVFRRIRRSA